MKKNTVVALLLIVAIFGLGIAYAAITNQTLVVEGTASATTSDANFEVKFTGTPETAGEGTTVATINQEDDQKANITVSGLTTKGQIATATYTIQNASPAEVVAKLTADVENSNPTWYNVTTSIANETIAKDATTTITVSVELLDTPATDADVTAAKADITVTIDAAAQ